MHISYKELNSIFENLKLTNCLNDVLLLRSRRALSWLKKSENEDSEDAKFIFLWISLNCTYSQHALKEDDRDLRNKFFDLLLSSDNESKTIFTLLNKYPADITLILNNEFIHPDYWNEEKWDFNQQNKLLWAASMQYENNRVSNKLSNDKDNKGNKKDVNYILNILFTRLYVLRNQIFHGGSTFEGSSNRTQVADGCRLMQNMVPLFIKIMLENPLNSYSEVIYPPADR